MKYQVALGGIVVILFAVYLSCDAVPKNDRKEKNVTDESGDESGADKKHVEKVVIKLENGRALIADMPAANIKKNHKKLQVDENGQFFITRNNKNITIKLHGEKKRRGKLVKISTIAPDSDNSTQITTTDSIDYNEVNDDSDDDDSN